MTYRRMTMLERLPGAALLVDGICLRGHLAVVGTFGSLRTYTSWAEERGQIAFFLQRADKNAVRMNGRLSRSTPFRCPRCIHYFSI